MSDRVETRSLATRQATALPVMSFGDMVAMGDALLATGFLPAHLRSGAQVAAVILTGRELGMEPMRAVRSLALVKGKVVESADSQLARFKADGGRAVFQVLSEQEAVLQLRHPNGDEHLESFTMQDARNAGLAGSETYKKFPKAMLRSRVITAGLKSLGWEGGVGTYDPDELQGTPLQPQSPAVASTAVASTAVASVSPQDAPLPGMPSGFGGRGRLTLEDAENVTAGKAKQRLGAMDDARLETLRQWAEEKGNLRLVEACAIVLTAREGSREEVFEDEEVLEAELVDVSEAA